jgi:hypothetical protein
MAYSFSEDEYFSHINDILDGKITRGAGRKRTKTSPLFVKQITNIRSILQQSHIRIPIIQKYSRLTEDDLFDYDDTDFIVKQLKNNAERIGFKGTISKTLYSLGFTKRIAEHTEKRLEPFIDTCYTDSQLIDMAIEQIFGLLYNNIIHDESRTHYFTPQNTQQNTWFEIDNPNNLHNSHNKNKTYNVYNASFKVNTAHTESVRKSIHDIIQNISKNKNKTFYEDNNIFFHTTTWECTNSIMFEIMHSIGRKCLDFGLLPGFYMGTKIHDTLEWGEKISKNMGDKSEIATIVFAIPKKYPDNIRYNELFGKDWEEVVSKSRKCKRTRFEREIDNVYGYDLIYGPMAANPKKIKLNNEIPLKTKDNKMQLVSKSDLADSFVQKNILGIIYYKK